MMNIQKAISSTLAVAGLAAMGMGAAHADIIPVYQTSTPGANGVTTFTYRIDLTNDQQANSKDSFVTIYDFLGLVPGSVKVASGDFTSSVQNLGVTPARVLPDDSATIPNLTFTYTGPTLNSAAFGNSGLTLGTVTADTTETSFNPNGTFAAQAEKGIGLSTGTLIQNIGSTTVPQAGAPAAVPEPGAMVPFAFGGLGVLGLMIRARKNRR